MNRDDFIAALQDQNIDANMISFDEPMKDGYCIRKNSFRWETLIKERGNEYEVMGFPSEENALDDLLERLLSLES